MLEGKVIKQFADKENNSKIYRVGSIYKANDDRLNILKAKGYVTEKAVKKEEK